MINFKFQISNLKSFRRRRGFTLIEVLVAALILGITVAAVSSVIGRGMRVWRTGHGASEIGQTARITQDVLMRDLDNIYYMSESSYNVVFRTQAAALAQRFAPQIRQGDMRALDDMINKALTGEKGRLRSNRRNDPDGQRDAFADLTLETIAPPIDLSFRGSEARLTFARSYKPRFAGDQDTWGLRRVTYFVREKVLYRREEDPFGFRMSEGSKDLMEMIAERTSKSTRKDPVQVDPVRLIQDKLMGLYAVPEDEEDEAPQGSSDTPRPRDAAAARLLPTQVHIEEPLCAGVEIFKIQYGYFKDGEWTEDQKWDSSGREHRMPPLDDLVGRLTGNNQQQQMSGPSQVPLDFLSGYLSQYNIPDDLPGYVSIQLGVRMPDGKGKMYSFTVYHSLPEAQEKDVLEDDNSPFGLNPGLPHL